MKNVKLTIRILALVLTGILLLTSLAACDRSIEEEKPIIEVAPDVKLKGESSITLLDRGDKPVVKIGPFEISADFIRTYLKKKIVDTNSKITALAAAYEIAGIFYAERSIAGTEEELSAEQVQAALEHQEQIFDEDLEANLEYCELLGISREESIDFILIRDMSAYVSLRHADSIYSYLRESYENRLAYEGLDEDFSDSDLSAYYPEYMKVIVRWLDIKHLEPDALDKINEELDVWIKEYVTG